MLSRQHFGFFPRIVPSGEAAGQPLQFAESEKTFDTKSVYGDAPKRTQL